NEHIKSREALECLQEKDGLFGSCPNGSFHHMLDAICELPHRHLPVKNAASTEPKCFDRSFLGRFVDQNDNRDFWVSMRYRVRQFKTCPNSRTSVSANNNKIDIPS